MKKASLFLLLATFIVICLPFYQKDRISHLHFKTSDLLEKSRPITTFSYNDLTDLLKSPVLNKSLKKKLEEQLSNPYISNINYNPQTYKSREIYIRPYIRVAHWNIERGFNVDDIKNIFTNKYFVYQGLRQKIKSKLQPSLKKELDSFSSSDIISLNEVDIGMPRTNYRNIVSEISEAINYNYVFATEFLELSPILAMTRIDPNKYLGLHGNAVLSKYPILSAKVIRLPECYKWYEAEKKKKSPIEYIRRAGAKSLFREKITNEVRRGNRNAVAAEILLPSNEVITVVSTHIEDRCYPSCRLKQVNYLLEKLKYTKGPLVLTGDFNTTTTDSAPTSIKKEITKRLRDPNFLARQATLLTIPVLPPGVGNLSSYLVSKTLQYKDPAAPSIPVLFPNQERKIFTHLKKFRFYDGEGFDFRGDGDKSSNGKNGLLANSNERQLKGFESTFKFEEPRIIAYFKLDWFFIKPKLRRFEPFNGQTLKLVNHNINGKISDHDPITVDLNLYPAPRMFASRNKGSSL